MAKNILGIVAEMKDLSHFVNFSVNDGNGCCIFINSNDTYPLILKLQNEFLK